MGGWVLCKPTSYRQALSAVTPRVMLRGRGDDGQSGCQPASHRDHTLYPAPLPFVVPIIPANEQTWTLYKLRQCHSVSKIFLDCWPQWIRTHLLLICYARVYFSGIDSFVSSLGIIETFSNIFFPETETTTRQTQEGKFMPVTGNSNP